MDSAGVVGTVQTIYNLLHRPALNRIVIGVLGDTDDLVVKSTLPNSVVEGDGAYHFGFEDPRSIRHGSEIFLLATREIYSLPVLFLTRVLLLGDDIGFGPPVRLKSLMAGGKRIGCLFRLLMTLNRRVYFSPIRSILCFSYE